MNSFVLRSMCLACLWLLPAAPSASSEGTTRYFRDYTVEKGASVPDAVCVMCSIHIKGEAAVAVAVLGSVEVEGTVTDTVVVVGGGLKVHAGAKVQDTVVVMGGPLEQTTRESVGGQVTVFPWVQFPGQRRVYWRGALGLGALLVVLVWLSYGVWPRRRLENMVATLRQRKTASLLLGVVVQAAVFLVLIHSEEMGDWEDAIATGAVIVFVSLPVPGLSAVALASAALALREGHMGIVRASIGAVALGALMLVPVAGLGAALLILSLGAGVLFLSRFGSRGAAWK